MNSFALRKTPSRRLLKSSLLATTLFVVTFSAIAVSQEQGKEASNEQKLSAQKIDSLASLTNLQTNNDFMYSSGLPAKTHLSLLKNQGVSHVVDLIPGDRSQEIISASEIGLTYFNVPVDWEKPALADFLNYAAFMQGVDQKSDKVLTHCKLNWRGASFTYLYRVNVLGEDEAIAKKDLLSIWQPNPTWYQFMDNVIAHYNAINDTQVAMSFDAYIPEPSS